MTSNFDSLISAKLKFNLLLYTVQYVRCVYVLTYTSGRSIAPLVTITVESISSYQDTSLNAVVPAHSEDHSRVEWFSTYCDFRILTHCCWSGIILGVLFHSGNFGCVTSYGGGAPAAKFKIFKNQRDMENDFFFYLQISSFYFKEQ